MAKVGGQASADPEKAALTLCLVRESREKGLHLEKPVLRRLSMATTSSLDMSCISVQLARVALPGDTAKHAGTSHTGCHGCLELHICHGWSRYTQRARHAIIVLASTGGMSLQSPHSRYVQMSSL